MASKGEMTARKVLGCLKEVYIHSNEQKLIKIRNSVHVRNIQRAANTTALKKMSPGLESRTLCVTRYLPSATTHLPQYFLPLRKLLTIIFGNMLFFK